MYIFGVKKYNVHSFLVDDEIINCWQFALVGRFFFKRAILGLYFNWRKLMDNLKKPFYRWWDIYFFPKEHTSVEEKWTAWVACTGDSKKATTYKIYTNSTKYRSSKSRNFPFCSPDVTCESFSLQKVMFIFSAFLKNHQRFVFNFSHFLSSNSV